MRWIPFVILVFVVILVQTTVGKVLTVPSTPIGPIGPDLAAILAVFLAMRLRTLLDVALASWALGLAVDLVSAAAVGAGTKVGPMALTYMLAGATVFRMREALFGERVISRVLLALVFAAVAHLLWVLLQALLTGGWEHWWPATVQAMALSLYTAVLAPLGCRVLERIGWFLISAPMGRARRARR